jgi:uncharacterized protein (TIGR00369 family)
MVKASGSVRVRAMSDAPDHAAALENLKQAFTDLVPHNRALGLELTDFDRAGIVVMRLPYRPELIGNPDNGVLHGGAITTLLDAAGGASVFVALWSPDPIATLDLRIDYMKPAAPLLDVYARTHCYRLTKSVAFVRGTAYQNDESDPIATMAATFMLSTRGAFAKMST